MFKKNSFDKELKKAEVSIFRKGKVFRGVAIAHEEDMDVASEKVGLTIANARAHINMYERRAAECRQNIEALKRQMVHYESLEKQFSETATSINEELTLYLQHKAEFAAKLRKHRKKA